MMRRLLCLASALVVCFAPPLRATALASSRRMPRTPSGSRTVAPAAGWRVGAGCIAAVAAHILTTRSGTAVVPQTIWLPVPSIPPAEYIRGLANAMARITMRGLGTITVVLFLLLSLTGMILMFLYVPSVERAYQSIKDLEFVVSFGSFLRAVHRISAHLMVAVVFAVVFPPSV